MRLRVVSTAASLLAVVPGVSQALGLGDIQLRSSLNAPLSAEIELVASAEELSTLRTQIASRDAFSRYGLEYPAFLAGIQVKPVRLPDGRNVIQLTSSAAMTEPFATILVEAVWARGRIQREYTVLLDPPAFAPVQAAAPAPVAAPSSGAGERSGAISRSAPAPIAAPAPAAPTQAASSGGTYSVRGGDSLSAIARREYGTAEADRGMIAIYRSNPNAFDGNINQLRAGAVLRLPDNAGLAAIDRGEAASEVRRQMAAWSPGAASSGSDDARLRLVPPGGTSDAGSAETQALRDRVSQLESELAESRRLLELRNAELARLQGAAPAPAPKPAEPEAGPEMELPAEAAPAEPAPAEQPAAEQQPEPAPAPAAAEPEADSGSGILGLLQDYWKFILGAIALLLAAIAGLRAVRRRRESSSEELAPFAVREHAEPVERDTSSDTFPLRKPEMFDANILVEESGTHERPALGRNDTMTIDLDESSPDSSMSVRTLDATTALDQGDPLAEADFHMAYGLYDQAADLIKLAIEREPARRDLKLKLLEVYFVWGNKDHFLQSARELADSRAEAQPGEWEKVVIMGKQLAPEDALFSQSYSGVGPAAVDLNLEGGQNMVDFDLHGEPSVSLTPESGVDVALESDSSGQGADQFSGLDFTLDDMGSGDDPARTATTRQMAQPGFEDAFSGNESAPTQRMAIDGPTVEQPALDMSDTLATKLDAQVLPGSSDQTAELAIDDLGLDLGSLEGTGSSLLDDSRLVRALESPDAPTLVAGMDETSRRLLEESTDANQPTELLPISEIDLDSDSGATSRVAALDLELELDAGDLDSNAETGKRPAMTETDFNLDLDVGSAEPAEEGEHQRTQRIDPPQAQDSDLTEKDLEPVTMSEVGTKLDLARAYMDMGDPDGARSILNEVLQEGSANQRQEAQRLIDSIPG